MRAFHGGLRTAFLCFFVSHIPITILIDGQAALSPYYPQMLRDVVAWYCRLFGDVLMMSGEPSYAVWFSAIVFFGELLLCQLRFFFVAVHMLWRHHPPPHIHINMHHHYPEWFRKACLIYGAHVSTTLVPILATFLGSREMTGVQKCMTIAIYSPYLILFDVLSYICNTGDYLWISLS